MPHANIDLKTSARAITASQSDRSRAKDVVGFTNDGANGNEFSKAGANGPCGADFAWPAGKIIVEPDGSQYADLHRDDDARRTSWLVSRGYQAHCFRKVDGPQSPQRVAEAILAALSERNVRATENPSSLGFAAALA